MQEYVLHIAIALKPTTHSQAASAQSHKKPPLELHPIPIKVDVWPITEWQIQCSCRTEYNICRVR